jgi:hypothetical protein
MEIRNANIGFCLKQSAQIYKIVEKKRPKVLQNQCYSTDFKESFKIVGNNCSKINIFTPSKGY